MAPPSEPPAPDPEIFQQLGRIELRLAERSDNMKTVLATFSALGHAISARVILLVSLVGAFALGCMVMAQPDTIRLLGLCAYGILAVLPVVWLEIRKRA